MAEQGPRTVVLMFDVNETLLDLTPVNESIARVMSDERAPKLWFTSLLHYSLVMTASGQYAPFTDIGATVLQMMARTRGMKLEASAAAEAIAPMRRLQAFPDVRPALLRLRQHGYRLAALTNSSQSGMEAQLAHAGLAECFERQLSVETLGQFKPATALYQWAAREMECEPERCMMIAAHAWDVAGAKWAGMQTAFVSRPGQQWFGLAPEPDLVVPDLGALADRLCSLGEVR